VNIFIKVKESFQEDGLSGFIKRSIDYLTNGLWVRKKIFKSDNAEDVFNAIYETNYWGSDESVSGTGSEKSQTELISSELPKIFNEYGVNVFLDAPCGDFSWMSNVIEDTNVNYIGADIVDSIVKDNNKKYSNTSINFMHLDICKDELPQSDIMLCRDCLFHLSFNDIKSFFINFVKSDIPYLLLTNHIQDNSVFNNHDILTGDFRMLDLFSNPINLSTNVEHRFDDFKHPQPPREICLFTKSQISECIAKWR
jgi:hypothetical protein